MQHKGIILQKDREVLFSECPPYPRNMQMELTNMCNHRCVFCGYRDMKRPIKKCDKQLMFRILEEAYELGTREVGFYMIGETFLLDDVEDYVEKAHLLGYEYIYMTTNGVYATLERVKKCYDAGLNSIKFSVNASNKEDYQRIHGRDDFNKVLNNITQLHEAIDEMPELGVYISYIKNEWNKENINELHEVFDNLVDEIYIFDCKIQGGGLNTEELINRGIVAKDKMESLGGFPCRMLFNRFHVTCEGILDACCVDFGYDMAVADLRETSLKDAWYSESFRKIRRMHLERQIEESSYCFNCINLTNNMVTPLDDNLSRKMWSRK